VEVHVSLVGRKDLAGEIYRQLRRAILDGRLPPGGRLPATRELARRLSVSRTTVTVAYDRLTGEGFVTARTGAGTFVSDAVPAPADRARPAGGALRPRPFWDGVAVSTVFERAAEFDFRLGIPDAQLFPYRTWRQLLARQLRPAAVGNGAYGDPAGHQGLRQAIARHLGVARAGVLSRPWTPAAGSSTSALVRPPRAADARRLRRAPLGGSASTPGGFDRH